MSNNKNVLEFKNITKKYPGTLALDSVSLNIEKKEVFGLVGKNGAGKSTLLKILSGAIQKYEGEILLDSKKLVGDTYQIIKSGISMVYQGLNLALDLTVEENILLGLEITRGGMLNIINHREQRKKIEKFIDEMNINIDLSEKVGNLDVDKRQLVAIIRAVTQNAKVIALDEPTSALTNDQVEKLFEIINNLKKKGVTFIFVSHHLNEVFAITDRIAVLRDGQLKAVKNTEELDIDSITNLMLGEKLNIETKNINKNMKYSDENIILKVNNLKKTGYYSNINFNLYEKEVLGIAGLTGSGKNKLVKTIFGDNDYDDGEIYLNGEKLGHMNPITALKKGIAYLPEDRHNEGLFNELSVGDNITIENMEKCTNNIIINHKKRKDIGKKNIDKYRIKTTGYEQYITSLSGGNQQKAIFARLMNTECDLIILNEPTQGVDVMSKDEIHDFVMEFINSKENRGVIVVSSDLPELVSLCNRVIILKEGNIVREVKGEDVDKKKILKYML